MNRIALVGVLAAVLTGVVLAAGTQDQNAKRRPRRPFNREEWYRREGGWVTRTGSGKAFVVVNAQSRVGEEKISSLAKHIQRKIGFVVDVVRDRPGDDSAGAIVELVEEKGTPRLLVAPEDAWAKVNVEALASDGADGQTLEDRTTKELWRGVAMIGGASDSLYQPCLMREIHSLKDLDEVKVLEPSPEAFNMLYLAIDKLNLRRINTETYRRACSQGWAPPPTNDVQRAIWEETRKLPAKPIQIKYDPKKKK